MSTIPPSFEPAYVKVFAALLAAVRQGRDHAVEAAATARALAAENVAIEAKTKFLRELTGDLWTGVVLAEFAKTFRDLARDPGVGEWADQAIDVCGTGGDHSGTFNVSTTAAFVVASAGVPVFKHGNRAATSKSGSADFLQALGIPLEAPDEVWRQSLGELNFAFFYAPVYHPAFKHVGPARKALAAEGHRTIFNILGPLINPGYPRHQLVGVFSWKFSMAIAAGLEALGTRRGVVVHGHIPGKTNLEGLDELSACYENFLAGAGELRFFDPATLRPRQLADASREPNWYDRDVFTFKPEDAGIPTAPVSDLAGGDAAHNITLLKALLEDRVPVGLRDTVCLNAGTALWVAGKARHLKDGVARAKDLLLGGKTKEWLEQAQTFFKDVKQ